MTISPLLAGIRPDTSIISVLFPHPDGPTMETNSPAAMSREILSSAFSAARVREANIVQRLQCSAGARGKYLFDAGNADERLCDLCGQLPVCMAFGPHVRQGPEPDIHRASFSAAPVTRPSGRLRARP